MATPSNQVSSTTSKPPSAGTASSRWSKSGEQTSTFDGPSRPQRGRSGRVRNGGRSNNNPRTDKPTPSDNGQPPASSDKPARPTPPAKPTLSITSPPDRPSANSKPKNSPRHPPSRTNSSVNTSQSSPVVETPATPSSSRSSNRRKRSGAGKANNVPQLPKIIPPAPNDALLRPGRPQGRPVPHSAPLKDTPPHLSHKSSHTSHGSFDMSKDIDALVERVRAVAMAENRPSTPGSHIDWAGDDDDSLPDLDDWGIPSLSEHKAQTISPIIVGGLKPLPEPSSLSSGNPNGPSTTRVVEKQEEVVDVVSQPTTSDNASSPTPLNDNNSQRAHPHPSLPPKPQTVSNPRIVNEIHKPMASRRPRLPEEPKPLPVAENAGSQPPADNPSTLGKEEPSKTIKVPEVLVGDTSESTPKISETQSEADEVGSGGLAHSIHAPSTEERTELGQKEGLMASIHAPSAIIASNSSPVQPGGQPSRNRPTHMRAQTTGRPFPRPNDNFLNRSPRMGRSIPPGSPRQHARNHSSPSGPTGNHRATHTRPVLTGDAISRLARTIGNATTPPPKSTPVANDVL